MYKSRLPIIMKIFSDKSAIYYNSKKIKIPKIMNKNIHLSKKEKSISFNPKDIDIDNLHKYII